MKLSERITTEETRLKVKDANIMWDAMAECIRRSAKGVLGTSRRDGYKMKGAWWWNVEAKRKLGRKK